MLLLALRELNLKVFKVDCHGTQRPKLQILFQPPPFIKKNEIDRIMKAPMDKFVACKFYWLQFSKNTGPKIAGAYFFNTFIILTVI